MAHTAEVSFDPCSFSSFHMAMMAKNSNTLPSG